MIIPFYELWNAHPSHRLDPKYHLFKAQERRHVPKGWITLPVHKVMRRRETEAHPEEEPMQSVQVMTITNKGEIRPRASGKGKAPPEWLGMYFEESPSTWFAASTSDVVYSSIDLWKGCIAVVPEEFDGALVTKEFPIYEVTDDRVSPDFLQCLLRTRYYQRAFRAITTGHSNRRRTQQDDFEQLEITFPLDPKEQARLAAPISAARQGIGVAERGLKDAQADLDRIIDGQAAAAAPVPDDVEDDDDAEE
jgi:type I restriction enzyme M protein